MTDEIDAPPHSPDDDPAADATLGEALTHLAHAGEHAWHEDYTRAIHHARAAIDILAHQPPNLRLRRLRAIRNNIDPDTITAWLTVTVAANTTPPEPAV